MGGSLGGMQALASGAQSIMLGESDIVLAGGIENMSRVPYLIDAADARWGHKMGHFQFVDAMYRDGFQCPLSDMIMGETAEVLARLEVRLRGDLIVNTVTDEEAKGKFPKGWKTPKPYLSITPQPNCRQVVGISADEGVERKKSIRNSTLR